MLHGIDVELVELDQRGLVLGLVDLHLPGVGTLLKDLHDRRECLGPAIKVVDLVVQVHDLLLPRPDVDEVAVVRSHLGSEL